MVLYYPPNYTQNQMFRVARFSSDNNSYNGSDKYKIARSRFEPWPPQKDTNPLRTHGVDIQENPSQINHPCKCMPNRLQIATIASHHQLPRICNICACPIDNSKIGKQVQQARQETHRFYSERPLEVVYRVRSK